LLLQLSYGFVPTVLCAALQGQAGRAARESSFSKTGERTR
jgi:hypothetical protein